MIGEEVLLETVRSLISKRAEGVHWDFKRQHHESNAELIHDVLCLANADHVGERFLIFGVEDATFTLHSIGNSPDRRTQADIASLFRDNANKFFQSMTPAMYLTELNCNGALVDVLVIEDKPYKPYYLVEDYAKDRKRVRAHHVYTRVGDTNTPLPDAAPPHEIERMWRERLGLDRLN